MRSLPQRVWNRFSYLVSHAIQGFAADRCSQLAAAISYRFLFSVFPLAIFLVSILGLFLRDDATRQSVIDKILEIVPLTGEGIDQLERVLRGVATPWSVVGLVSIAVTLWSASGLMAALRIALNAAWGVTVDRPWVRSKLVDFVLVLGAGLFVTASLVLTGIIQVVDRVANDAESALGVLAPLASAGSTVFGVLLSIVLSFVTFGLLYRFVPAAKVRLREVWFAALVAALGFEVVKNGFAFYVREIARYNVIYGSLGAIVAFLFLVYLSSLVFLFGAEMAAEWDRSAASRRPYQPPDTRPIYLRLLGALKSLVVLAPVRQPLLPSESSAGNAPTGRGALLVLGSISFDSIETPYGRRDRLLGGSAIHAALAASFFTEVRVVARAGDDFGEKELALLRARGIEGEEIVRVGGVRTPARQIRYGFDLASAERREAPPGADDEFQPTLSEASATAELVFLGGVAPDVQREVRAACRSPRVTVLCTSSHWIKTKRGSLVAALGDVEAVIVDDSQARRLTGESGLAAAAAILRSWGPTAVVVRHGENGTSLFTEEQSFTLPPYAFESVVDPTGASHAFAGGFLGYLASQDAGVTEEMLRTATAYGTVLASFSVEELGSERLQRVTPQEIGERLDALRRMTRFESLPFVASPSDTG